MGTRKKLLTALMAFFALTMFFACEKGEGLISDDLNTTIETESSEETSTNSAKGVIFSDFPETTVWDVPMDDTSLPFVLMPSYIPEDTGTNLYPYDFLPYDLKLSIVGNTNYTNFLGNTVLPLSWTWDVQINSTNESVTVSYDENNNVIIPIEVGEEYLLNLDLTFQNGMTMNKDVCISVVPLHPEQSLAPASISICSENGGGLSWESLSSEWGPSGGLMVIFM